MMRLEKDSGLELQLSGPDVAILNASRSDVFSALELFHAHVKYTISLMLSVVGGVFAILAFAQRPEAIPMQDEVKILGQATLTLLPFLGFVSVFITARYYRLYVSAVVFCARLHRKAGVPEHPWLGHLSDKLLALEPDVPKARRTAMARRVFGPGHSWFLYSSIILLLGIAGLLLGPLDAFEIWR